MLEATLLLEADLDLPTLLRHIVEEARSITGARFGALGVVNHERTALSEFVTAGIDAQTETQIGARPKGLGVLGLLINDPQPLRLSRISSHPGSFGFPRGHPEMTSFLGVPIMMRGEVFGNLYLTDKIGWSEFTLDDEETVVGLAVAAGIAIDNAHMHRRVQEVAVYADRDRVARDLHDNVIQRLFGAGLALQSMTAGAEPEMAARMHQVIEDLVTTIRQIRNTIFELGQDEGGDGFRSRLLSVLRELDPTLGFKVDVSFGGPVDTSIPQPVAEHLLSVTREALTNVARHARATRALVEVTVQHGTCRLIVVDNGRGAAVAEARGGGSGLVNMRQRAQMLQGNFEVTFSEESGTSLIWQVPIAP